MGLPVPLKFHVGERLTVSRPAAYFLAFSGLAAMRRASSVVNGFANDLPQGSSAACSPTLLVRVAVYDQECAARRPEPARRYSGHRRGRRHEPAPCSPGLPVHSLEISHQVSLRRLRSSPALADNSLWLQCSHVRMARRQHSLRAWRQIGPAHGRSLANTAPRNSPTSAQRTQRRMLRPIAECS